MYKILIVDDERKEREGILLLIKRYGYDLDVTLAQNGEEALKIMEKKIFDILLTDIKMPYMDGIQLIKEIQKRGMNPICIIYSAYGEFEYAQSAISLGVLEYLLKPIRLEAFDELFKKVIALCVSREKADQEEIEIRHAQEEAAYQKMSWDMLNYLESDETEEDRAGNGSLEKLTKELKLFIDFNTDDCIPIVISCYSNLFSIKWEKYQKEIEDKFGDNTIIINNTDNQIIVLLIRKKGDYRFADIKEKCESLIGCSQKQYQAEIFVILGKKTESLSNLRKEYYELKDQLDYQFFLSKSVLIVHDESYFIKKENDMMGLYFERIFNCARMSDYRGIEKELEKVFDYVTKQTGFSSIYIKYTFTDAIKKICEYTNSSIDLVSYIEQLYLTKTIEEVKAIMKEALNRMERNCEQEIKENRLVRMAKSIIYEKYGENNLNVSFIAEELKVSTAYLSSLYKIETGQNLVKFITWYRVEKSKELLKQTNMKVSDIAEKVGYLNTSYYTSIFRNYEGCSPVQYRERSQKHE